MPRFNDNAGIQHNPEVHGVGRIACPCHHVILTEPILRIFREGRSLVGGEGDRIVTRAQRLYCIATAVKNLDGFNLVERYAKRRIAFIAANKSHVAHIWQTVDNDKIFENLCRSVRYIQCIANIFRLHALYIVIERIGTDARIASRVSVFCAIFTCNMSRTYIFNRFIRIGRKSGQAIVRRRGQARIGGFTCNDNRVGVRITELEISAVGEYAILFLILLNYGRNFNHKRRIRRQGDIAAIEDHGRAIIGVINHAARRSGAFCQRIGLYGAAIAAITFQVYDLCRHWIAGLIVIERICRGERLGDFAERQICRRRRIGRAVAIICHKLPNQGIARRQNRSVRAV